ncbi:MAG: hypothetical protein JXA71_02330 [Chitinispirillaceae bacterium]|nr:hypothetical protein [Chitinispirillaceae bacterium]
MAVQGVDRAADVARTRQNDRAEAVQAENERRRADAEAARQEQRTAREADRGGNVDVRG